MQILTKAEPAALALYWVRADLVLILSKPGPNCQEALRRLFSGSPAAMALVGAAVTA